MYMLGPHIALKSTLAYCTNRVSVAYLHVTWSMYLTLPCAVAA